MTTASQYSFLGFSMAKQIVAGGDISDLVPAPVPGDSERLASEGEGRSVGITRLTVRMCRPAARAEPPSTNVTHADACTCVGSAIILGRLAEDRSHMSDDYRGNDVLKLLIASKSI